MPYSGSFISTDGTRCNCLQPVPLLIVVWQHIWTWRLHGERSGSCNNGTMFQRHTPGREHTVYSIQTVLYFQRGITSTCQTTHHPPLKPIYDHSLSQMCSVMSSITALLKVTYLCNLLKKPVQKMTLWLPDKWLNCANVCKNTKATNAFIQSVGSSSRTETAGPQSEACCGTFLTSLSAINSLRDKVLLKGKLQDRDARYPSSSLNEAIKISSSNPKCKVKEN